MANRHLISKLKSHLEEAEIRVFRSTMLRREVTGKGVVECVAWWDGGDEVHLAVKGKSAQELVHSVIHELVHMAGYNEEAVEDGLDNAAYTSRSLREAVAFRLMEIGFGLT